jgi:hypothetical protein
MKHQQLRFDEALLTQLRRMSAFEALNRLGLDWKLDGDFSPSRSNETRRIYVSVGAHVFELIVTGNLWWDARDGSGGGGAIDLSKHLLELDFVASVKRLCQEKNS